MEQVVVRAWWSVVLALGRLFVEAMRLFWRAPAEMMWITAQHHLGDREAAQRRLRELQEDGRS